MRRSIDLNCDLGEGFGVWQLGDDEALLDVVTSANVACGFHAGDPSIMGSVCERAAARAVTIGAQVGYRDLAGFGRRHIDMEPGALTDDILYQIGALDAFARRAGDRVRYVKPHGALYNRIVTDEQQAAAVVAAVRDYDPDLPVLGLPGSRLLKLADETGLETIGEAFADRAYTDAGHLVPRGTPGAVIDDPEIVATRVRRLAVDGRINSIDGVAVAVPVRSVCVHGDTPRAVDIARRVKSTLDEAGIEVSAFVPLGGYEISAVRRTRGIGRG